MLPIGGSGRTHSREVPSLAVGAGPSPSAWMTISSGGWPAGAAAEVIAELAAEIEVLPGPGAGRKEDPVFSASARWIPSICRLLSGAQVDTGSPPMIGVSLSARCLHGATYPGYA